MKTRGGAEREILKVAIGKVSVREQNLLDIYEGWNFNSGNYLFTTDENRYMFRSFTVLQCSHQHCVQPLSSDVEVVGYL